MPVLEEEQKKNRRRRRRRGERTTTTAQLYGQHICFLVLNAFKKQGRRRRRRRRGEQQQRRCWGNMVCLIDYKQSRIKEEGEEQQLC